MPTPTYASKCAPKRRRKKPSAPGPAIVTQPAKPDDPAPLRRPSPSRRGRQVPTRRFQQTRRRGLPNQVNTLVTNDVLQQFVNTALAADNPATANFLFKAIHPDTGDLADYPALLKSTDGPEWEFSITDEISRLANGRRGDLKIKRTQTIHFNNFNDIPAHKKATYLRIVAADRPNKAETRRIRWTVGGNLIIYDGNCSTRTADLTTSIILFNSVVSTKGARFMVINLKNFYLETPMTEYEYMRIRVGNLPPGIIEEYNLQDKIHHGAVYVEIRKGMYGLPQAGILANCVTSLHPHARYVLPPTKPRHKVQPPFGVQYTNKAHCQHLIDCLDSLYELTVEWQDTKYLGLTLAWDYRRRTCLSCSFRPEFRVPVTRTGDSGRRAPERGSGPE
jgi:hypothetical protein